MTSFNRTTLLTLGIGMAALLFVCTTIISSYFLRSVQIDLTEARQYTLSEGTKNILEKIDEPITLKFFFSAELAVNYPQLRLYGERVQDLLKDYAARAGDNIRLQIIDPKPFTDAEDDAVAEGITALPTETGENIYFGLVGTNSIDGREAIPYIAPEREASLEYDLTQLVYKLVRTDKPVLGILSSIPLQAGPGGVMAAMQGQGRPFVVYEQLQSTVDIKTLDFDADRIEEDITTLLIVHPAELSPQTLYAIDQFILRGGHAVILLDPLSELSAPAPNPMGMPQAGGAQSSDLGPLMAAWGVAYDKAQVVTDLNRALRIQTGIPGGRPFADYVPWLGLTGQDMDGADLVTANLTSLNIAAGGHLEPIEEASTNFAPLLQSTENSMLLSTETISSNMDPDALIINFLPTAERYTLAARISGNVETAFPDGPPPSEPAEEEKDAEEPAAPKEPLPAHINKSQNPTNLIVIADSDFLDDKFWVQEQNILGQRLIMPIADNGTFLINSIESLLGSSDLISLRSRARDERPLEQINAIRQQAEARFLREQERLEAELAQTEERLAALEAQAPNTQGEGSIVAISAEQEAEIERFREIMIGTRKDLRAVQRNLLADVENLQSRIRFVNIGLMPAFVALFALGLAMARRRARIRSKAEGTQGEQKQ